MKIKENSITIFVLFWNLPSWGGGGGIWSGLSPCPSGEQGQGQDWGHSEETGKGEVLYITLCQKEIE